MTGITLSYKRQDESYTPQWCLVMRLKKQCEAVINLGSVNCLEELREALFLMWKHGVV